MELLSFRHNRFSQNGEDGVLSEIFTRLGGLDNLGTAVEFGAWDGKHLSNTFNFVQRHGWKALYIEGDEHKYRDLLATANEFPSITPVRAWVGIGPGSPGEDLDQIIVEYIPGVEIDLLSIDIDSSDLEIWARLRAKPKVVVIEINSGIEPGILRWHNPPKLTGNSFSATLGVAERSGYKLVCHTGNMIFVRSDLVAHLNIDQLDLDYPERLFLTNWIGLKPSLKERLLKLPTRLPVAIKMKIRKILKLRPMTY